MHHCLDTTAWFYGLTLLVPPGAEPVTLEEAKAYLRVDIETDDLLITTLIQAAREHLETVTRYQLAPATYRLDLPAFPPVILVPKPPLQSVTSIEYRDTTGALLLLDPETYVVQTTTIPGRITPVTQWPNTGMAPDAVQVTYVAGFVILPAVYRALILLLLGDLYEHREAEIEARLTENKTYMRLLWGARLVEV